MKLTLTIRIGGKMAKGVTYLFKKIEKNKSVTFRVGCLRLGRGGDCCWPDRFLSVCPSVWRWLCWRVQAIYLRG